jgi:hypothetical protein
MFPHAPEKGKKGKETANSNVNKRLSSKSWKGTEEKHSLYGKKRRKKTKVQSKDKTGFYNIDTKDLKAAREEKVKTYLQVSLFSFSAEGEIKPSERCCQGLAANLPLRCLFSPPFSSQ